MTEPRIVRCTEVATALRPSTKKNTCCTYYDNNINSCRPIKSLVVVAFQQQQQQQQQKRWNNSIIRNNTSIRLLLRLLDNTNDRVGKFQRISSLVVRNNTTATTTTTSLRNLVTTTTKTTTTTTNSSSVPSLSFVRRYPWLSFSIGTIVIMTGGMIHYIHTNISGGSIEGLQRSFKFYSFGIPKYLLYRYYMLTKPNDDILWDELNTRTSQQGLDIILQLQGFYIKCGQLCASNIGNAFPPIWQDTMSILQDQCPYQPYNVIIETIKKEYQINDVNELFESIDPIPIGAASIGQVHRAKLKLQTTTNNDGTTTTTTILKDVVIKICYPNVEQMLRGDVRTIKSFAQIAQPVHVPGLNEIEQQFATEFDYQLEGYHLSIVRQNLVRAGLCSKDEEEGDDDEKDHDDDTNKTTTKKYRTTTKNDYNIGVCRIPKPYLQYCTKRVLVMEELPGDKLVVALQKNLQRISKLSGIPIEELLERQKNHPELNAEQYDHYNTILLNKNKVTNISSWLYNTTVGLFRPSKSVSDSSNNNSNDDDDANNDTNLPLLNPAKLIDDLFYIHGHEILVDGIFNSDPHPGNILLCRNPKNGQAQLGLIDYGQVKKLSKQSRHRFARLLLALADDNKDDIVSIMKQAGYKSKYMNPDNIYLYAKVYYDENNDTLTDGLHPQLFVEKLQRIDPIYALPEDFISIGRTSMVLRGLADALHQHRSMSTIWKPIAQRILQEDI